MTSKQEIERIARGLSKAQRVTVLVGFAGPFSAKSERGMKREWYDICQHCGPYRNHWNTIRPMLILDLAEKTSDGLYCLTPLGLAVRACLQEQGE